MIPLRPILIGVFAALLIALPSWLKAFHLPLPWGFALVAFAVVPAVLLQQIVFAHRTYSRDAQYGGLEDFIAHLHSPPTPELSERWSWRGVVSFLLSFFGAGVGIEGAAAELGHGVLVRTRSHSLHWFELQRRTDIACALTAAISAAFGAPFAAVLIPTELKIGGRAYSIVLTSLSAYITAHVLSSLTTFEVFKPVLPGTAMNVIPGIAGSVTTLGVLAGSLIASLVFLLFLRYSRFVFTQLCPYRIWARMALGGALLFFFSWVHPSGTAEPRAVLEPLLAGVGSPLEAGMMILASGVMLCLILSAIGSSGVFFPTLMMGSAVGVVVTAFLPPEYRLLSLGGGGAALLGAAGAWGGILGVPLAGTLLAFELTGDVGILLPAFLVAMGTQYGLSLLRVNNLVDQGLLLRGMVLDNGRERSVLDAIPVIEAMVDDFETVKEHDSVTDLYSAVLDSRYPFLPVVGSKGKYVGLLTVDMVEEAWENQEGLDASHSNVPLTDLLEAKDLLYRSGLNIPCVQSTDSLSATTGKFEDTPVIPVLGLEGEIEGLLFAHNVRIAYDQEVARRTIILEREVAEEKARREAIEQKRQERVGKKRKTVFAEKHSSPIVTPNEMLESENVSLPTPTPAEESVTVEEGVKEPSSVVKKPQKASPTKKKKKKKS